MNIKRSSMGIRVSDLKKGEFRRKVRNLTGEGGGARHQAFICARGCSGGRDSKLSGSRPRLSRAW